LVFLITGTLTGRAGVPREKIRKKVRENLETT
jgi:hypothetical protein